ncbi:hypothetical protein QFC22_000832 [Naganishia vaughanmartiniae]|uniref:Uncharacterized protein n=1 Tax=Naganishia vaughanmartiniae TaxID=1424756 RepID=A0ACC2XKT0_9TREE|nr:hypothetical protein QFC22_000832 [Naganishia vaughanmartiniae]
MPFGFKKPSRSYAGSANAYYDPVSGYPTPYDPAPRSVAGGGVTKGYVERDDERIPNRNPVDGGKKKRARSDWISVAERTDSAGSSTSSRGLKKPVRNNNHVHYAEPTNTPSQLMRPRSGAQAGIGKGKGKGRAVQDISAAMAGFSALDLAPPPPKSKRKTEEEEEEREADDWRGDQHVLAEVDEDDDDYLRLRQNHPPNAGFSSGDVSETEAEADSELSQDGEDQDEQVDSDYPERMAGSSLAGASAGESQHTLQPYIQDEAHTEELVRPSLRIEQYNDHGQLTPPTSEPGHGIPRGISSSAQGMSTLSNSQATSYDAASPWSFHPAPLSQPPVLSQPLIQVRPESRSSVHSRTAAAVAAMGERIGSRGRGKDQVSRKYALAPPLYPLAGASAAQRYRDQAEMEMRMDESAGEGPATPVQNASLAPPTFALQPPTPQHDLTHTPFHHSEDVEPERERELRQSDGEPASAGYQLPHGLALGALVYPPATTPSQITSMDKMVERPGSKPTSSRSSSHSTKSSHASGQVAFHRQGAMQYSAPSSVAHRSASPTPPQSAVGSAASSGSAPPAPMNPNQPAFLKWDPSNHRWIPVPTLANNSMPPPQHHPMRPESVMSSVSAYSQMSAVRPGQQQQPQHASSIISPNQARRQSLPTLALSPAKSIRRAQSPAMSSLSRPASPSMGPILASPIGGSSLSGVGFNGRRMSIDPPYLMNSNTLTLLPEMHEADLPPAETPLSPRSAPHSRAPSIDGRASAAGGYGYRSSFSSFRPRNSTVFPAGYDVNARAVEMSKAGSGSRSSSVYGDYVSEGEHRWQDGMSRATSVHEDDVPYEGSEYDAKSQMGGSAYLGGLAPSVAGSQSVSGVKRSDSVKPGRESALDVMSVRGDSVQIHGLDGSEQPAGGYSSLVLPTGAYVPSDPSKATDRLDHRLLGMPHSTMSTITISDSAGPSGRRSSLGGLRHHREAPTPAHLLADMPAPVSFSSHQAPPTKISASQVLVQVHAVALDKFDSDMVKEKAASGNGAGKWIPGRSFVGRALDVGADVRVIMKGDIVMGLLDIRKSGCLAEYIVCDRRRLARIPLGVNLSLEEVACLPMLGVTAHRACIGQTRGSRALILNAHEGVGALAAQELSSMGLHVIAHVPLDVPGAEDDAWENGAKDVIADDAVAMINAQHESGFEFVLDTIGGRKIYDACRRVLRSNGVFVTMFGDDTEHVPSAPQVKSSMHALRRAFIKKDKKAISYVHLLPGGAEIDVSGQDTRDMLELPVMALYRPKVSMVVPFERAPEAFEELASLVSGHPREDSGSVVVRLSN